MTDKTLQDVTDKIYDSLFYEDGRQLVVDQVTEHLGYDYGAWFDPHIENPQKTFMAFRGPDGILEPYIDYYATIDKWQEEGLKYDIGQLMVLSQEFNRSTYSNDECYNDYIEGIFKISGACCIKINEKDGLNAHFTMYQSINGKGFDPYAQNFMKSLTPHLIRFDKLHDRVAEIEKRAAFFDEALNKIAGGVIVIGSSSKIIASNRRAEVIMQRNDGFNCIKSKLSCKHPAEQDTFLKLVNASINPNTIVKLHPGDGMRVSSGSSAGDYQVIVAPLGQTPMGHGEQRAAIVFIDDPAQPFEAPSRLLCDLYGLTPAEARVALCLVQGHSLATTAQKLKVTESTARHQLKQIFLKTGTGRQGELISLILRGIAAIDFSSK